MSWSWNLTPFCSRGRLLLGSSILLATWSSGYQLFFPFHQRCAMCMEQKARCSEYYINVINVYFSSHCRIYCSFVHGSVVLDDEDDGGGRWWHAGKAVEQVQLQGGESDLSKAPLTHFCPDHPWPEQILRMMLRMVMLVWYFHILLKKVLVIMTIRLIMIMRNV